MIRNPTTGITVMAGTFVYMANPSNVPEISVRVISLFLASVLIVPSFFIPILPISSVEAVRSLLFFLK